MDSLVQYPHPPVYAMTHTKVVLAASVTVNSNLDILFHIHMKIFTSFHCQFISPCTGLVSRHPSVWQRITDGYSVIPCTSRGTVRCSYIGAGD